MNLKLLSISVFLILAFAEQSNAKSIGSDVEISKLTNGITSLNKRESDNSSEESEESKSSVNDEVSDGQDSDSENKEEETNKDQTSNQDEKSEEKIGCFCKSCPKKKLSSKNSDKTDNEEEKPVNKSGCPCKSSQSSKCPCKNCPKKGCPFFKGILNRTQDPVASLASEFVKVLKNALNGTHANGNINIIVAIAGSGGSVQINAADANVTSLGNASVKVVQIDQTQQADSSNQDEKIEIESSQLTTQESEIVVEVTELPKVSESVETSVGTSEEAEGVSEQIELSSTPNNLAIEETTIA